MSLTSAAREIGQRLRHTRLFHLAPRGLDCFTDIAVALPKLRIETIFDVGANVGQSTKTYVDLFPASRVFCFEPVGQTFHRLQDNTKHNPQVRCFQLAFYSSRGHGAMWVQDCSELNRLVNETETPSEGQQHALEKAEMRTLDEFCATEKIQHISYLKIDTEGSDLEVLKGGESMLSGQQISLVEVEASMNPQNKQHVPFCELKEYLERHRYYIFGIYQPVHEWPTGAPILRRTNPVFISEASIPSTIGGLSQF